MKIKRNTKLFERIYLLLAHKANEVAVCESLFPFHFLPSRKCFRFRILRFSFYLMQDTHCARDKLGVPVKYRTFSETGQIAGEATVWIVKSLLRCSQRDKKLAPCETFGFTRIKQIYFTYRG